MPFYFLDKPINITDFISQKNKFIFQNQFDEIGTKDFLNSKEKALMEINLDDEINDKKNECELEINNNILKTELINKNDFEENIQQNKKAKLSRERTSSSKVKSHKKIKNSKTTKNFHILLRDTEENSENNKKEDMNNSEYFYKFIIENANETEERFYDKLENEMKKIESKNKDKSPKRNINKTCKSLSIKKINSNKKGKNCKSDKKGNPFNFCEVALGLMTKEKLELSGIINEENEEITAKDKCQSKTRETSYKKDDIKNNLFHKNKTIVQSKIIESKVINSEKSSLISLLSGLIK